MAAVTLQFFGDLNDFLPARARNLPFASSVDGRPAVKDVIEAAGVPHPEVAGIVINTVPGSINSAVGDGDMIQVYSSATLPVTVSPLDTLPTQIRFVLDVHLGRLAGHLRMLGFDTLYRNDYDDPELAEIAARDERILLTRDLGLLKRSLVRYGAFVRAVEPQAQVREVVRRFQLVAAFQPMTRCTRCNGLLEHVAKAEIVDRLPPKTRVEHNDFRRCRECRNLYWKGSHYDRIAAFIADVAGTDTASVAR